MASLPSFEQECFFITPIGEEHSEVRRRADGVLNAIVTPAAREVAAWPVPSTHLLTLQSTFGNFNKATPSSALSLSSSHRLTVSLARSVGALGVVSRPRPSTTS
jgi:hypothetical protein